MSALQSIGALHNLFMRSELDCPGKSSWTIRSCADGKAGKDSVSWSHSTGRQGAATCTHGGIWPGRRHDGRVDPQTSASTMSLCSSPTAAKADQHTKTFNKQPTTSCTSLCYELQRLMPELMNNVTSFILVSLTEPIMALQTVVFAVLYRIIGV